MVALFGVVASAYQQDAGTYLATARRGRVDPLMADEEAKGTTAIASSDTTTAMNSAILQNRHGHSCRSRTLSRIGIGDSILDVSLPETPRS